MFNISCFIRVLCYFQKNTFFSFHFAFMLFSTLNFFFWNIKKCPFTYWLNCRWFLQILDKDIHLFICGCSSFHIGASYLSRHWCLSQGTSDRRSSPGGPKTAPWSPQTALGVLRPQTETMYSWDTLFISLPQVPQQRESTEYWSRNSMTVVTARVFYVVSAFFYFHPQYQGRMHLRFYVICESRGAHRLMLQGREINLLFLSTAPGIDPGSAGVRLQCFTHRPRRPTLRIYIQYILYSLVLIFFISNVGVAWGEGGG